MDHPRLIHSSSDHLYRLRETDPDLPDFCWRILTGYKPNPARPGWEQVREFVIEAVLAMKPRTHTNARRLMTMTALYVSWVWTVTGCALVPEKVFRDHLVHRYLAERLAHRSADYRFDTVRQLAIIGEVTAGASIRRLRTPHQSARVRPYSDNQHGALYSWANTLSTEFKRQNARAFLGLGAGAGLTAQEITAAQVEDVGVEDGRVFVSVATTRPRRVPVLASWAKTLTRSLGNRTSGHLFRGYRLEEYPPNALQRFLSDNPCDPRPSAARLHTGWVVTQINAGLPLAILLEITGFTSTQSLQPYLKYAQPARLDDYIGRITGERVA